MSPEGKISNLEFIAILIANILTNKKSNEKDYDELIERVNDIVDDDFSAWFRSHECVKRFNSNDKFETIIDNLRDRISKLENIVIYMTCASMGKLEDKEFKNLMLMLEEITLDKSSIKLFNLLQRNKIKEKANANNS